VRVRSASAIHTLLFFTFFLNPHLHLFIPTHAQRLGHFDARLFHTFERLAPPAKKEN
jgi:hypothetical protein